MQTETLDRLGSTHTIVWLKAKITASKKTDLFIGELIGMPDVVETPAFYMDESTVRVSRHLEPGESDDGEIMALLFGANNGTLSVQVLGDAISYGPNLLVPRSYAE